MLTILGIIVEKGGVGKTTSILNIAHILSIANYRVLVVDLDKQGDLSQNLMPETGYNKIDPNKLLLTRIDDVDYMYDNYIHETPYEYIDIIPSVYEIKETKIKLGNAQAEDINVLTCLRHNLKLLEEEYDYIIIDTNPGDDLLIEPAICACDKILTPVKGDSYSFKGIRRILSTASELSNRLGLNITYLGMFLTMVKKNTNNFKESEERYKTTFPDFYIPTYIRESTIYLERTFEVEKPLLLTAPKHAATLDYLNLVYYLKLIDAEHMRILQKFLHPCLKKEDENEER